MENNQQENEQTAVHQENSKNEAHQDAETNPVSAEQNALNTDAAEPMLPTEEEKAKAEAAEWKDKYLRLYAEFDNFRSRSSREKVALISTATEDLMKELLPVMDDFERSLKAIETSKDVESLREGVQLVYHKFSGILRQKGLSPMESIGKAFDADFHEAVTQIPAPDPAKTGLVVDEIEKGYSLNEKTIRFAKVIIGS
jgi:molecular chaperone GrpE